MPFQKPAVRLMWRGKETVRETSHQLAKQQRIALTFPANFHHSFWVRLSTHARFHGMLDVTGDSKLLEKLSHIRGLSEIADLCEPATKANARVRVRSPTPQIVRAPASSRAKLPRRGDRSVKKRMASSD